MRSPNFPSFSHVAFYQTLILVTLVLLIHFEGLFYLWKFAAFVCCMQVDCIEENSKLHITKFSNIVYYICIIVISLLCTFILCTSGSVKQYKNCFSLMFLNLSIKDFSSIHLNDSIIHLYLTNILNKIETASHTVVFEHVFAQIAKEVAKLDKKIAELTKKRDAVCK